MFICNLNDKVCTCTGVHDGEREERSRSVKCPRVNKIFFQPSLASGYTIFRTRSDRAQCLHPRPSVTLF